MEVGGVAFSGVFPSPPFDSHALKTDAGATVHLGLSISNHTTGPLRFSEYESIFPELLDRGGKAVPFEFGANIARLARATDYHLLAPGQSLVVPIDATLTLRAKKLEWRGANGSIGQWGVTNSEAPYRLRLKYHQGAATAGPFGDESSVLKGLWVGEAVTDDFALAFGSLD
jgi:hypothetical protein